MYVAVYKYIDPPVYFPSLAIGVNLTSAHPSIYLSIYPRTYHLSIFLSTVNLRLGFGIEGLSIGWSFGLYHASLGPLGAQEGGVRVGGLGGIG